MIDIVLLLEGIGKISPAIMSMMDVANTLCDKWFVSGKELIEIKKKLEDTSINLNNMIELNNIILNYLDNFDSFSKMKSLCKKIEGNILITNKDLAHKDSVYWDTLKDQFSTMKDEEEKYIKMQDGLGRFFSKQDAAEIGAILKNFTDSFNDAQNHLDYRNVENFEKSIRNMSTNAGRLSIICKESIKDTLNKMNFNLR